MQMFVSLNTEKDFKKFMEFLAEQYKGSDENTHEVLCLAFHDNLKEEYFHETPTSICMSGYEKTKLAEENDYALDGEYLGPRWKEFSTESKKFFLGDYYLNFSSDWDRSGNIETQFLMKIEEPKYSGTQAIEKYHELLDERLPIARAMDKTTKIFDAARSKGLSYDEAHKELKDDSEYVKPDFDRHQEIMDELNDDFGIGIGLK